MSLVETASPPLANMVEAPPRAYNASELLAMGLDRARMPQHIAIIMDGNGRWAQQRGLPRIEGHRRGVSIVRSIVEEASQLGLSQLTLYCFSSENWKRPEAEQRLLMQLLEQYLIEERGEIYRQRLQFAIIGRREGLSESVLREMQTTIDGSIQNTGMRLCLAINYGSRGEIADAVRTIAAEVQSGRIAVESIDEASIEARLYTAGMPDPDLVIRTAGEMRISNFLLWQLSYAELWVTPTCWPEFSREHLRQACRDYAARDRRFGGLNS